MELLAAVFLSVIAAAVGIVTSGEPDNSAEYAASERRAERETNRRERVAREFRRDAEQMRAQAANHRAGGNWWTAAYLEHEAEKQDAFAKELGNE